MPVTFFTLPVELRLRIYDHVLISRWYPGEKLWPMDRDKKMIMVDDRIDEKASGSDTFTSPALLRTCRTIYLEASPILYTKNSFGVRDPRSLTAFMQQIGSTNTRYLRTLILRVTPSLSTSESWVKLLDNLAQNLTGLRKITIVFYSVHRHSLRAWRLGNDLNFVHALAKIQGLKTLEIRGVYAPHWPACLEEKMGVSVDVKPGCPDDRSKRFHEIVRTISAPSRPGDSMTITYLLPRTDRVN